jgi:hypothetical protein
MSSETEFTTLVSGTHGRERRLERNVEKIDLQRARRYGIAEPSRRGRIKYTYGGVVFIYDPKKNIEITSWQLNKQWSSESSGTKVFKPVILTSFNPAGKDAEKLRHANETHKLRDKHGDWTSHSVLVVDMSGSMRRDDISGARCRSDGVWYVRYCILSF